MLKRRALLALAMSMPLSGCWKEVLIVHKPHDMYLAKHIQTQIPWQLKALACDVPSEHGRHCWVSFRTDPATPAFAVNLKDSPSVEGAVSPDNPLPLNGESFPGRFELEFYEHRPGQLYVKFNSSIEDDNVKPGPAAMELRNMMLAAILEAERLGGESLLKALVAREEQFNKVRRGTVARYTPVRTLLTLDPAAIAPSKPRPPPTPKPEELPSQ